MKKLFKYKEISNDIIKNIRKNIWESGDMLPSESKLCEIYNTSRITIRRSLSELLNEKWIYTIKGVGTFVSSKNKREITGGYGFSELLRLREMEVSIDIISFKIIKSDDNISKKLDIKLGSEVYEFVRIYRADGRPAVHTTSWLPCDQFSDLDSFDFKNNSLYKILRKFYDVNIIKKNEEIYAVKNPLVGAKLNEETLLFLKSIFSNDKGKKFEYAESYINTNIIHYFNN